MIYHIIFAISTVLIPSFASADGIVARAEVAELRLPSGKIKPRVVPDKDGHVRILFLNDMKLSEQDFVEIGKLGHLRALVLLGTNVTDRDLTYLTHCQSLDHLNLVRTEVTDHAIDTILELQHLRSLCLGDVRITPAAMERLKERNCQNDAHHQLLWGYSQRKP